MGRWMWGGGYGCEEVSVGVRFVWVWGGVCVGRWV